MGGDEDHVRREAAAVARKGSRDDGRRLNRPSQAQKTPKTPCCISFSDQGTMVEATAMEGGSSPAIDPGASLFDGYGADGKQTRIRAWPTWLIRAPLIVDLQQCPNPLFFF